ncbi:MAG: TRAM domain-containing protein, partial [Muribaculaceae bacterium]|nr:TRAM domain-containing protein [Muribaculaceae bacterium]
HNIVVTGVAAEGKALARVRLRETDEHPIVVFIPYGAPGDIVNIKIDKKKHNFAEAHITEIIKPSADRREPLCGVFGTCGGCRWQHLPYEEQLKHKRRQVTDALERIAKVELPEIRPVLGSVKEWGYRNKMEYTFSDKRWRTWDDIRSGRQFDDNGTALGFHIPGAFDKVLHIEKCHLQEDKGDEIRNFIYDYAVEHGLSFYNIKENHGLLRTLMIRISSTGEIMVCLTFGEDNPEVIKEVMEAIRKRFPEITSLLYVVNLKLNDSIADQEVIAFHGPEFIEEEMEGLRFRINAKSFYQTNSLQAYELYKVARDFAGLNPDNNQHGEYPVFYDLYT